MIITRHGVRECFNPDQLLTVLALDFRPECLCRFVGRTFERETGHCSRDLPAGSETDEKSKMSSLY